MPSRDRRLWTATRKAIGNLIPLLFVLPALALALREAAYRGLTPALILWLLLVLVVGWISVGLFGLVGNTSMKKVMWFRQREDERPKVFVGFARPSFRGVLDAHEDIGFLCFEPDRIEFVGEERRVAVERTTVTGIHFQANAHTWLGLGRWIAVEIQAEGKRLRLLIEPRDKATLIGNFLHSRSLRDRLVRWRASGSLT